MATADQIEKIVIDLEEQGAGKAYVNVKRVDDLFTQLGKQQGPIGVLEGFNALQHALSRSLVDLPNMAALTDQARAAWAKLVAQLQKYDEMQTRKHSRNEAIEAARKDAQELAAAQRAANRVPTELQAASNPQAIDWAGALATQSQKAGSAIEAAAHSALDEATALSEAAKNAQKLASVYDVIENRAKAAARADQRWLDQQMRAANRIPTELQQAPKALSAGQKAMQAIGRTFGPRATEGITSVVEGLEKIGPIASKVGPPLASAAMAVGAIGIAAAGGAALAAKSFATSVIEAQAYKEDVLQAFKTVERARLAEENIELKLGKSGTTLTDEAAKASNHLLDQSNELADRLGIARNQLSGQFLDLTTKGFKPGEVKKIIGSLADLGTIDSRAATESGREGLTKVIGQIKATGRINQETLNQLNTFGLESGDVMAEIGRKLGKDDKEVLRMLSSSGGIRGLGVDPIIAAIEKQTGAKPGEAMAAKADRDLSILMQRVKNIPTDILFDVEVGGGIDGVKSTLRSVIDFFDVKKGQGKEVRAVTGDLFNALIEGLTGDKVDTKKGITGTLDAIVKGARQAVPLVRDLASGARTLAGVAASVGGALGTISEWTAPIGGLFNIVKKATFPLRVMASALLGPAILLPEISGYVKNISDLANADWGTFGTNLGGAVDELWAKVKTGAASIFNDAINIGMNLWQGLVQGIQGGIGAVTSAATNLANSALGAVGSTWRVGSPARAFEDLAIWGGEGSARGFYKSAGSVADAAGYMADQALGAASMTPANANSGPNLVATGAGGAGGGIVITFAPTIIVSGANSPAQAQALGAAAAQGARPEFEAMLGAAARRLRYG